MDDKRKCFFCDNEIKVEKDTNTENLLCICKNCGNYRMTREVYDDLPSEKEYINKKDKLYLISGYLREMNDREIKIELISKTQLPKLFSLLSAPKTLSERIDNVLLNIYKKTDFVNQAIYVDVSHYATYYGKCKKEYENIINEFENKGFLKRVGNMYTTEYKITMDGLEKARLLQKKDLVDSKQCFMAMKFDQNMINNFNNYIQPRIKEETEYDAIIVSMKEHNDKICDVIIAEIRKSKFLIADFTGQRGGVYFEAGFAYGLGIQVIWTCKKEDYSNLQFDVDHYNFILWDDPEELSERICKRILATII